MDRPTSIWLLVMSFALISSVALYSCVPHIEEDLAAQSTRALGDAAAPDGWAAVVVDGQQLILTGEAPTAAGRDQIVRALKAIPGVVDVQNQTVLKSGAGQGEQLDSDMTASAATAETTNTINSDGGAPATTASTPLAPVTTAPPANTSAREAAPVATAPNGVAAVSEEAKEVEPKEVELKEEPKKEEPKTEEPPEVALEIPKPVIPADLPEALASCQRSVNALLAGSSTFFSSGSSEVAAESRATVQRIAESLKQCGASFEIAGHTDNSGRTRPNQRLSQARADAIRAELVALGVTADKVSAVGYGESVPLVSNKTPEGRRINRRIEIKVHKPVAIPTAEGNGT